MNEFLKNGVKSTLRVEEGEVPYAYKDHLGFWTIGVGAMIDKRKGGGLPKFIIDLLLDYQVEQVIKELNANIGWWVNLHENARKALILMGFQMGVPTLLEFENMLGALRAKNYEEAREHALDSKWYREDTPERAVRVANLFVDFGDNNV